MSGPASRPVCAGQPPQRDRTVSPSGCRSRHSAARGPSSARHAWRGARRPFAGVPHGSQTRSPWSPWRRCLEDAPRWGDRCPTPESAASASLGCRAPYPLAAVSPHLIPFPVEPSHLCRPVPGLLGGPPELPASPPQILSGCEHCSQVLPQAHLTVLHHHLRRRLLLFLRLLHHLLQLLRLLQEPPRSSCPLSGRRRPRSGDC
mmetsp:Transcript_28335/g.69000  ORF Transcript_28335/g.69000 Transcript_28335/m.69000 type:complete len:203 (-) Transcript_28335:789-1397(-)